MHQIELGNASDRASDEDILVSSGRLGWKWFRLGTASDRARMKTVSFRLGDLDGDGFVLELHQIELA